MSGTNVGPNQNPILYARNTAGGLATYVTATNNKLDVNATASLAGSAIPISGATTAVGVAIVDGSGNQITSFGGGTQYTDGGVPPAHPVAATLEWSDGANWQTVSTAKPLPITIAGGLSNPLPVSLTSTTITGTVSATQSGTWNIATVTTLTGITNALPAGSNVIGHVITDTNSTTAVTQATASSLNATVVGTGTFATQSTPVSPATIFNGKTSVTTAGTRVVLAASQVVRSVVVKALAANTGTIYVGNATVAASNGFQLAAGDTVSFDLTNLNTINLDCSVNGEGVTYMGIG
jgi:hypothetical protein